MGMRALENIHDKLCDRLEEAGKSTNLSASDLDYIWKLTDTMKNIKKIEMLDEGGYSAAMDEESYGRGSSYANRGQHYVRGHYSRDGGGRGGQGGSDGGYSSNGGYSGRRDDRGRYSRDDGRSAMMEHLEMAMDAATEQDRETIKRFMRQMENA